MFHLSFWREMNKSNIHHSGEWTNNRVKRLLFMQMNPFTRTMEKQFWLPFIACDNTNDYIENFVCVKKKLMSPQWTMRW